MKKEFELIAKTFQGLEEVLATELTELGADNIQIGHRMVSFTGDLEMMYRANFCLRTAIRILKPIKHFEAEDADGVYAAVKEIDWSEYLGLDTTFAVDTVVFSTEFRHSKFVAYKVKDAIVDYFRETTGQRPSIRVTNPDIKLNMHIADKQCTLSLDASGESLHLRGYREASVEAPINEVLAAGLLKLAGWDGSTDLIDPMCGSGTILIEAALMARNIYPGVFRKGYAFENWKDFDAALFDRIYNDDSAEREFNHTIYGYDINRAAIEATLANAKAAGVHNIIKAEVRPLQQFVQPEKTALMVTNPPYGERITSPDLLGLYRTLGEKLKRCFSGNEAWVIAYRQECFSQIGLRPSLALPLFNGALDCEFRKYQLFQGDIKSFLKEGNTIKTDEDRRRNFEKKAIRPKGNFKPTREPREDADDYGDEMPANLRHHHRLFEAQQRQRTFRERSGGEDYDRRAPRRERRQDSEDKDRRNGTKFRPDRDRRQADGADRRPSSKTRPTRGEGQGKAFKPNSKAHLFKKKRYED